MTVAVVDGAGRLIVSSNDNVTIVAVRCCHLKTATLAMTAAAAREWGEAANDSIRRRACCRTIGWWQQRRQHVLSGGHSLGSTLWRALSSEYSLESILYRVF